MAWSFGASRDPFHGRQFAHRPEWGWFRGNSITLHLLCTIFLLSLHQLYLRSSGVISQRLGTPALGDPPLQTNTRILSEELCWQLSGGLCWFERRLEFEELKPRPSPRPPPDPAPLHPLSWTLKATVPEERQLSPLTTGNQTELRLQRCSPWH